MRGTVRTGVILAAVAITLWVVVLFAYLSTGPEDGANIGAGFIFLAAMGLCTWSSAAFLLLLARMPDRDGRKFRVTELTTLTSLVLWPLLFILAFQGLLPREALFAVLLLALAAFLASTALNVRIR